VFQLDARPAVPEEGGFADLNNDCGISAAGIGAAGGGMGTGGIDGWIEFSDVDDPLEMGGRVAGSFHVEFGGDESIDGAFDAPIVELNE
jgi:hypothetical protein